VRLVLAALLLPSDVLAAEGAPLKAPPVDTDDEAEWLLRGCCCASEACGCVDCGSECMSGSERSARAGVDASWAVSTAAPSDEMLGQAALAGDVPARRRDASAGEVHARQWRLLGVDRSLERCETGPRLRRERAADAG
jgi:hypothetical protein